MKKIFILPISIIVVLFAFYSSVSGKNPITITVVYDDYSSVQNLQVDLGFACLIEGTEKNILFDTGRAKDDFFTNIKKMNYDLNDIHQIVISHNHSDHTGNLFNILAVNRGATVYLPGIIPQPFLDKVKDTSAKVVLVNDPIKLNSDALLTGQFRHKGIPEQSLVVNTSKGAVVLVGCSHPGIVKIVKQAKTLTNNEIYMVMGGFHMARFSEDQVKEVISQLKELGVQKIGPTHCSGKKTRKLMQEAFGDNFVEVGVGSKLIL